MNKKLFWICVILIIIVSMCPLLIVTFWQDTSVDGEETALELSLNTEEEQQDEVVITAVAKGVNAKKVMITLPDGSSYSGGSATYTVTENGEYLFSMETNQGEKIENRIEVTNTKQEAKGKAYLPSGFSYLQENTESGNTIISDESGNEYVWIPVENGKFKKNQEESSEDEEIVNEFLESVNKYYGFYIGRYETTIYTKEKQKNDTQNNIENATQKNTTTKYIASSMKGQIPWTNINYSKAKKAAANSAKEFGYTDCQTALVNSYAWDATLEYMDENIKNYSTSVNYGNYSGEVLETGSTENDKVNEIFDMAGNVREWTTESYSEGEDSKNVVKYRTVRGGNARFKESASSYNIMEESTLDAMLGFRMVLYRTASQT